MRLRFRTLGLFSLLSLIPAPVLAAPNDELYKVFLAQGDAFRKDAKLALEIVDVRHTERIIHGHFRHPEFDPLDNHWFIGEMFSALAATTTQEESPRRNLLLWAGMVSVLERIDRYRNALRREAGSPHHRQRLPAVVCAELQQTAHRAFDKLGALLVNHTRRLNRVYYGANFAQFQAMALHLKSNPRLDRRYLPALANLGGWDPRSFENLGVLEAILAETKGGDAERGGAVRLGALLLISLPELLEPTPALSKVESLFATFLTDIDQGLEQRVMAGYGLALLGRAEDIHLLTLSHLLTALVEKETGRHPYADLCRRSLNLLLKKHFENVDDPKVALAELFQSFSLYGRELPAFLTVPIVAEHCPGAILRLAQWSGHRARTRRE